MSSVASALKLVKVSQHQLKLSHDKCGEELRKEKTRIQSMLGFATEREMQFQSLLKRTAHKINQETGPFKRKAEISNGLDLESNRSERRLKIMRLCLMKCEHIEQAILSFSEIDKIDVDALGEVSPFHSDIEWEINLLASQKNRKNRTAFQKKQSVSLQDPASIVN